MSYFVQATVLNYNNIETEQKKKELQINTRGHLVTNRN
jgi:hypothetical protein